MASYSELLRLQRPGDQISNDVRDTFYSGVQCLDYLILIVISQHCQIHTSQLTIEQDQSPLVEFATMSLQRVSLRLVRLHRPRFLSTAPRLLDNERVHKNAAEHREAQTKKPLNPHMTNTSSTIANEFPSVGKDKPPPDMITSVDPEYTPKDSVPENTERMTGGTQEGGPESGTNAELGVGEMEGAKFKVEPKRRTGEDANTMRARLLCPLYTTHAPSSSIVVATC